MAMCRSGWERWFTAQAIALRLVLSVRLYHPGRNSVGPAGFLGDDLARYGANARS